MKKQLFFTLILVHILAIASCQSTGLKVVIIRHGEKNEASGQLSCQGLHRALLLPPALLKKFGKPGYVYVPSISNGKELSHARMFQTITPFVVQNNLSVNSKYDVSNQAGVAADVMKRTGLVLLVWEHGNIPDIAKALGVKDPPKWKDSDYDGIWVITYSESRKGNIKASLATDSEGINPPDSCNF